MHPAEDLAGKVPAQEKVSSTQDSDNEVAGNIGDISIYETGPITTSNNILCNMICESFCLLQNRSKKNLLATFVRLKFSNDFFGYDNAEVYKKCEDRSKFFSC